MTQIIHLSMKFLAVGPYAKQMIRLLSNWSLLVFFALFGNGPLVLAETVKVTPTDKPTNSPAGAGSIVELLDAEKYVLQQLRDGNIADFTQDITAPNTLRARFLEDLLMGLRTDVAPRRNQIRIQGALIDEPIELSNAQINCEVWLDNCRFESPVDFGEAKFASALSCEGSVFTAQATFNSMKVGGNVTFAGTSFLVGVDFASAHITGRFGAENTRFPDKSREASFNGIVVGDGASFDGAVFSGPVNFRGSNIASQFSAVRTRFKNKEQRVSFSGMNVTSAAFFTAASFSGPVSFTGVYINGEFLADKARFKAKRNDREEKPEANFLNIKVDGPASFERAAFTGRVSFADGSFSSLRIINAKIGKPVLSVLDLSEVTVKQSLTVQGISVEDLIASAISVEGSTSFTDLVVTHRAKFAYGTFGTLDLSGSKWPLRKPGGFQLQGIIYKYVQADRNDVVSRSALLNLADGADYSADVYSSLEAFFLREGYRDDADNAHIGGRSRECRELLGGFSPNFLWSVLLSTIGYGRSPVKAIWYCVICVLVGWLSFPRSKMVLIAAPAPVSSGRGVPRLTSHFKPVYRRLWYSLELFLPFITLKLEHAWRPKSDALWAQFYMRFLILLGWFLVPFTIASVTGIIR